VTRIKPLLIQPPKPEFKDFRLVHPGEMTKNKNHAAKDPASLIVDPFKRFPLQPPYPSVHEAMEHDVRLDKVRRDRSLVLLTDKMFPQLWLRYSREKDVEKYIKAWHQRDLDDDHRHAEHMHELSEAARRHFFVTVYEIVRRRESAHLKMRLLQRATFEHHAHFIKDRTLLQARDTHRRIVDAFERRAAFWRWRLDDLYNVMENGAIMKVKGGASKIEHAIGMLCAELRHVATGKHHTWRLDNLFTTLANGGIAHIHKGGGEMREHVEHELERPKIKAFEDRFITWRQGVTTITTPNGGMVEMRQQGRMPEATAAKLDLPKVDDRRQRALRWHRTNQLLAEPNGGFHPASEHAAGRAPEAVTADVAWRHHGKVHCKDWDWRLSNLATMTGNGGFAPQKGHFGHSFERVSADASWPKKFHVTSGFANWHKGAMFGPTPNGGYAPLKGHGHMLEKVAAEATDAPREAAHQRTDNWHETHKFTRTGNGGYAPLKHLGQMIEHVGAAADGEKKDEAVAISLERHLENLFTPTSNHGWRRVGRNGQMTEHVTAQVMHPDEGLGAMVNLPSQGGHVLAAAELSDVQNTKMQKAGKLRQLQHQLEAHAKHESLLTAHVEHPLHPLQSKSAPPEASQITPKRARKDDGKV
jgi:hypothetical protein